MQLYRTSGRAPEIKRIAIPPPRTDSDGLIEGYASLFGVCDTGGDIVMAGAFTRSLRKRRSSGVKMLWQHRAEEPIGVWTTLAEDARGLKVSGQLDLKVARAREALSLLRGGAVDGLSIGFRALRAQTDKSSGVRRLLELDLWEVSIVTFPMLTQARVNSVKRDAVQALNAAGRDFTQKLTRASAQRAGRDFHARLQTINSAATGQTHSFNNKH